MRAAWFTLALLLAFRPVAAELETAAAVHALTPAEAGRGLPVRLEGVVTYHTTRAPNALFVQDATGGVFIRLDGQRPAARAGDRVGLRGRTGPGDYAPVVRLEELERLGTAPLPAPVPVTRHELAAGRHDSRRVSLEGVVVAAYVEGPPDAAQLVLTLRADGGELLARVYDFTPAATNLLDARVRLIGVGSGLFSRQRQLLAPLLLLQDLADMAVLEPPRPAAAAPRRSVESLFRHSPDGFPDRRIRVRGIVLGHRPGRWLALRDATGGLFAEVAGDAALAPGDEVELVGFAEIRPPSLWLVRAEARRLGQGPPPAARPAGFGEALGAPVQLLELNGRLAADPVAAADGWRLELQDGTNLFEVLAPGAAPPPAWRAGAVLAVRGVSEPVFPAWQRLFEFPFPRGLRLHARDAADVRVLAAAPWWSSPALVRGVAGGLAGALLLLGGAVAISLMLARKNAALREVRGQLQGARDELARRFETRTAQWHEELAARQSAEAEFAMLTAERTRLARELHDTVEQALASVALQLDAARGFLTRAPEQAARLLDTAAGQLRSGQTEVRRSVWGLRALALERASLVAAVRALAAQATAGTGPVITVTLEGPEPGLPPDTGGEIFRMVQEALANALKHAAASRIEVCFHTRPDVLEVAVRDDGRGFAGRQPPGEGPRFGLAGLHERAARLGAALEVESIPGTGTTVRWRVPRPAASGASQQETDEHLQTEAPAGAV